MANYYSILGVGWGADIAAIKSAYQRLEKRYNFADNETSESVSPRYERVRTAYEVLSDPIARQAYDSSLWRQRRLVRSRIVRSFSMGLVGAAAVCAMLVGYLPDDVDPHTLKSAIAAQSERDDIASEPKKRSAQLFSKPGIVGQANGSAPVDDRLRRAGTSFREVLSNERLAPEHDRLITRFASRMIGPDDFETAQRVATLANPVAEAATGDGATWRVEHGNAEPPLRNPQRSEPTVTEPSPVLPARPEQSTDRAAEEPLDKPKDTPKTLASDDASEPVASANKVPSSALALDTQQPTRVAPVSEPTPTGLDDGKMIPGGSREPILVPPPRAFPKTWSRRRYAGVGLSLLLPDKLFEPRMIADDGQDIVFTTDDGRALLRVYARSGRGQIKPEDLRNRLAAHRYGGAELSESKILNDGFLLAGRMGGERFYERVYVHCSGRTLHAWMMVYPAVQHIFFDKIVAKLDQSYKPVAKPAQRCNG